MSWKFWRLAIVNMAGLSALVVAIRHGFLEAMLKNDPTYLSVGIMIVCFFTLMYAMWLASHGTRRSLGEEVWDSRMSGIEWIYTWSTVMALMGLMGTVIGFILALQEVDQTAMTSAQSAGRMVATMIGGLGVALWTTLVGLAGAMWAFMNYKLLGGDK